MVTHFRTTPINYKTTENQLKVTMATKGGYDVKFLEDVSDHLICVICQLVFRDPVLFVECGHKLCNTCYEDLKEDAKRR